MVKYVDFPKHFVYTSGNKEWAVRSRNHDGAIGRIHTIHPLSGDTFYLRILLHHDHCKGATSFQHLKVVDGTECETFKEVCARLGLLRDDGEWDMALQEAALSSIPAVIRTLYTVLLLHCHPSNPRQLFNDHVHGLFAPHGPAVLRGTG